MAQTIRTETVMNESDIELGVNIGKVKARDKLAELCERHGIQTAAASFDELVERIDRQLTLLKRDLQRAKTFGKDPSGRWG